MTVSTVSSTTTSTSTAASSQATLSSNFDTFLTLLTAQLQNQDPLQPMDSSQFTQQLVEYSQVEQQINANKNLESLISLTQANSAGTAVSYLGKIATITDGSGALENGEANWAYAIGNNTATTTLTITNSSGKVVYVGDGETTAGGHTFTWDGKDNAGNQLADGIYTLSVRGAMSDGSTTTTSVGSSGTISEVDLSGSEPVLTVGSMTIPLSKISLIAQN